jgi:hypothetical protein
MSKLEDWMEYLPVDLPEDPIDAYARGWKDHAKYAARRAGSVRTPATAAAARANGAKGGRPKKTPENPAEPPADTD